jgi:hypothetical protein
VRTCNHRDQGLVRIGAEHVVLVVASVERQVAFWKINSYDRNNLKVARHDKASQGERPFQVGLSEECYTFSGDGIGSDSKQLRAKQTAAAVCKIKWNGSLLEFSIFKVLKQDFDACLMLIQHSDLELTIVCAVKDREQFYVCRFVGQAQNHFVPRLYFLHRHSTFTPKIKIKLTKT